MFWIPPNFAEYVTNNVIRPFVTPHVYHKDLGPVPWVQIIYSRKGNHVGDALKQLLKKNEIEMYDTIDCHFGRTKECLTEIDQLVESVKEKNDLSVPNYLVIVENAHLLCYSPDDEASLLRTLDLLKLKNSGILLVLLFNRIGRSGTLILPGKSVDWCDEYFREFAVDIGTHFESPDEQWRQQFFKAQFAEFKHAKVSLSDEDYVRLSMHSGMATQEDIMVWLRSVFMSAMSNAKSEITIDTLIESMYTRTNMPHICGYDVYAEENAFRTGVGKSPLIRPGMEVVKDPRKVRTSGFSTVAANVDAAKAIIEEQGAPLIGEEEPDLKKIKLT